MSRLIPAQMAVSTSIFEGHAIINQVVIANPKLKTITKIPRYPEQSILARYWFANH